jgi:histidinol-phosphatase
MKQSEFLQVALRAAKKAEEIILHYYKTDVRNHLKPDESPVSLADTEAEKIIIETIREQFPNHSFLGEESGENKTDRDYLWIIDPIDGTKHYLRGIPLFATEIALMHQGEIILGVSNAPIMRELIYAEVGQGAYLNGEKIYVSSADTLEKAYISYGGICYFEKHDSLQNLLSLVHEVKGGNRGFGDFWSYHLLASGKIEIMIEAQTKIWDIAALKVIVEEAGGVMTDMLGKPVNKDTTSIIASNKLLHKQILNIF